MRKRGVEARAPIGQFISIWYGEDGDDDAHKKRAPIGQFISIWYGEDGDDAAEATTLKGRSPDIQVSTPFIFDTEKSS